MSNLVSCRNVRKLYRRGGEEVLVLDQFNLEVASGEFIAIMGPSGSGKTTLLHLISGLDLPTAGEITVANTRLDQLPRARLPQWRAHHIGLIFQFYNLMPTLSAARNVEVPLLLLPMSAKERQRRVAAALDLVGLSERAKHLPSELSGGQQQRVAIARAFIADPTLLICDEPTGDLDRNTANDILTLLRALNQQHGKTIIMVTHDPAAAAAAGRRLAMDKGQIFDEEPAPAIKAPLHHALSY